MAQVTIRQPLLEDTSRLKELMIQYIVGFYKFRQPDDDKLNELIHVLLEQREGIQFVAESDGNLVGFATLYFSYSTLRATKIAVMNDLFVTEEFRGQGAAAKLFAACKGYAARNRYANLSWTTAKDNLRAQRFYEKMGGELGDWLTYSINPTIGIGD
ncbi:GNAT family N-acetyltransferase [Paenibacillus sp. GP183]|uniref:GNAT family N-acetyltransferase n=1 Tax=Paenibacillus sp. GP183 TaxID=1882751 RepID=UPI00089958F2|nr:GNAT family N-acetyltransferase [Paenibacillus sp. GP183]SEC23150.1 Ribosomal protein S18 acetylase RimI [Paenibacillus sp. GP183]